VTENVYVTGTDACGIGFGPPETGTDPGRRTLPSHISIAFNQSLHFEHMHNGNPVDVCYSVAENYYRGIANIQLRIKDIKDREVIV
jgi:single-stranded-DNA-specific exonuclease